MAVDRPILVGISGGSASGKTSICLKLADSLTLQNCAVITTDSFYRDLSQEQMDNVAEYNFDHPSAFDFDDLHATLSKLMAWETAEVPVYDYLMNKRSEKTITTEPTRVIILEGIVALYDARIRQMMDFKIFVKTDDDERLARRIIRDTTERGREVGGVIAQYRKFVKPSYDDHIAPMMRHADLIIPRGAENTRAIEMVVHSVKSQANVPLV